MNFEILVGRFWFDSEKAKIYAGFTNRTEAENYCIMPKGEFAGNAVLFIKEGNKIWFENSYKFTTFEKVYVFDCKNDVDIRLSERFFESEVTRIINNAINKE